jgi:hypothetical protein
VDAKQLACAHSSLILANNFAPVSEALCSLIIGRVCIIENGNAVALERPQMDL